MGVQRFAGQNAALSLLNTTTSDQILPDLMLESVTVTAKIEKVSKDFIGELGPRFRMFSNGADIEFKIEPNDAAQTVAFVEQILAKARGQSNDEFSIACKYVSPDGGTWRVILKDLSFDDIPFELAGQKEFLMSTLKASCTLPKFEEI